MKDRLVSWYIRKILIPKIEEIDHPGFIIENLAKARLLDISLRQVFLPEKILVKFEEKIIDKFGNAGASILYSIGKKFGYYYSYISNFPNIKNNKKSFLSYLDYTIKYIETTYASEIKYNLNTDSITFRMKDYIICSKNGIGYLFSSGGIAGIWAYVTQDIKVEAVKPKCQGRGDAVCEVIAAPYETIKKMGYQPIKCLNISDVLKKDELYVNMNKIRSPSWAKKSLKMLIDSGFLEYKHGQIIYQDERFFEFEINFMYIIEKELQKSKAMNDILWKVSFDWGKEFSNRIGKQNPSKFIMDFFPSLGFGDIFIQRSPWKVMINYFPFAKSYVDINFVMLRGIFSGIITGLTGNIVKLENVKKNISDKGFSLIFY